MTIISAVCWFSCPYVTRVLLSSFLGLHSPPIPIPSTSPTARAGMVMEVMRRKEVGMRDGMGYGEVKTAPVLWMQLGEDIM